MGTENVNPFEGLSDSDVRGQVSAAQAELERRAALPAAEQRARMARELEEIARGERQPGQEHLSAVSHDQVAQWAREGRLEGMGIARQRRRWS